MIRRPISYLLIKYYFKVPRVFINGKCIGGGDDTARLDKDNRLEPMLKSCGAIN